MPVNGWIAGSVGGRTGSGPSSVSVTGSSPLALQDSRASSASRGVGSGGRALVIMHPECSMFGATAAIGMSIFAFSLGPPSADRPRGGRRGAPCWRASASLLNIDRAACCVVQRGQVGDYAPCCGLPGYLREHYGSLEAYLDRPAPDTDRHPLRLPRSQEVKVVTHSTEAISRASAGWTPARFKPTVHCMTVNSTG